MGQQAARRTYVNTVARRQNLTDAVVSTLADSYLHAMSHSTDSASKTASVKKELK